MFCCKTTPTWTKRGIVLLRQKDVACAGRVVGAAIVVDGDDDVVRISNNNNNGHFQTPILKN